MGIYFLETGAVSRSSKVVYGRAHSAISTIEKGIIDWEEVFSSAQWFHWAGITPPISQGAADTTKGAIEAANDLNYCAKLWNYGKEPRDIMPELVSGCDVILDNEEDAEKHFGVHPDKVDVTKGDSIDINAYLSVCKKMV